LKLKGLTAVVTGSTSGIGKGIALLFAQEGANIVVVGRNFERGNKVIEEIKYIGGQALFSQTDLTVETSVREMVKEVINRFGQIDILVNNVGLVIPGAIPDINSEDWAKTWQTNVTSVYMASHEVIPYMQQRKSGAIVNIASEAGLKGLKNRAAYCSAKYAVVGMTKAMAVDHSGDGIRINCLCPGTIETEMVASLIANSSHPEQTRQMMIDRRVTPYLGTVEEVARAALFLCDPENLYTTGAVLSVDGGATAK
jgi:meso-butanediol dehydrogenase/(S,S)-butanediol dehydrogenase/diacetyl reductase